MKLRANVLDITGTTMNYVGEITDDSTVNPTLYFQPAMTVEIVEEGNGYFLFRYDSNGEFAGDSWFSSPDEAKRQAKFEFNIEESDWITLD